jgi:hypothetical protein
MMKGIRFHGRGGEGVVIAAELLAAAAFKEGKGVQSFQSRRLSEFPIDRFVFAGRCTHPTM